MESIPGNLRSLRGLVDVRTCGPSTTLIFPKIPRVPSKNSTRNYNGHARAKMLVEVCSKTITARPLPRCWCAGLAHSPVSPLRLRSPSPPRRVDRELVLEVPHGTDTNFTQALQPGSLESEGGIGRRRRAGPRRRRAALDCVYHGTTASGSYVSLSACELPLRFTPRSTCRATPSRSSSSRWTIAAAAAAAAATSRSTSPTSPTTPLIAAATAPRPRQGRRMQVPAATAIHLRRTGHITDRIPMPPPRLGPSTGRSANRPTVRAGRPASRRSVTRNRTTIAPFVL